MTTKPRILVTAAAGKTGEVTPTPDPSAYERLQNHPLLREPKYGLDYEP